MSQLFRQQAVDEQKQRLYGEISLAQPLSIYTTAISIFLTILVIAVFLYFSHYARKETVRGYLVPDKGIIKTSEILTDLYGSEAFSFSGYFGIG